MLYFSQIFLNLVNYYALGPFHEFSSLAQDPLFPERTRRFFDSDNISYI